MPFFAFGTDLSCRPKIDQNLKPLPGRGWSFVSEINSTQKEIQRTPININGYVRTNEYSTGLQKVFEYPQFNTNLYKKWTEMTT